MENGQHIHCDNKSVLDVDLSIGHCKRKSKCLVSTEDGGYCSEHTFHECHISKKRSKGTFSLLITHNMICSETCFHTDFYAKYIVNCGTK